MYVVRSRRLSVGQSTSQRLLFLELAAQLAEGRMPATMAGGPPPRPRCAAPTSRSPLSSLQSSGRQ